MCGTLDSLLALHVLTDCEGHWILVRSVCHFQKKWSDFVTEHTINEVFFKILDCQSVFVVLGPYNLCHNYSII